MSKQPPLAAVPASVTLQQQIALALEMARYRLQKLQEVYADDGELDDEESDIDFAVRVGLERIERMRGQEFDNYSMFYCDWFGVAAILKLALK